MPTLNIGGRRVQVDDSFMSLSPEQQEATVDEIASGLGGPSVVADVAKQVGAGLVTGTEYIAAAPAQLAGLAGRGFEAVAPSSWISPEAQQQQGALKDLIARNRGGGIAQYLPTPETTVGQYARTAAEFVPAAVGGFRGSVPAAAALGATSGLASEAAGQATAGTSYEPAARVVGAVLAPGVVAAGRRIVTPLPVADAERIAQAAALRREGIPISAGQATGSKRLQYFEAERGSPALPEMQREQFTRAVLERVGENATRATPEVIDRAFTRVGRQFDDLAARNTLRADQQLGTDLRAAIDDYNLLVSPPNRAPIIANFEAELGTALTRGNGTLPGEVYQSLRSRMERAARSAPYEVSGTIRDMRGALDDAMERSLARAGSRDLGAWREARGQYRDLLTIERAATSAGENAALGLISPAALRMAVVNQGRRAYARGQRDLGELARAGVGVMSPLPNSGTPGRTLAQNFGLPMATTGLGASLGALLAGPVGAAIGGAAGGLAPSIAGRMATSAPGRAYLANQLLGPAPQSWVTRALITGAQAQ